jgi:3-oxoacyl-[acyl-carrier-protein] synthase-3
MASIKAISYYLPKQVLSNEELNGLFPEWSVEKISAKTGIFNRHIAAEDEYVSTMAVNAARNLFLESGITPDEVDFILLCTQSPDYFLPTTACLVQDALGIPVRSGALDFNLGCSGYIYGLSLAKGLIASGDAKNVLLLTSETYSRHLDESDKGVRTIFGDAAAATFITAEGPGGVIGKTVFGTDGRGAENLMVRGGGMRYPDAASGRLTMNGGDIFAFTLERVPQVVSDVLRKNELAVEDIDLFIFHQANKYMLQHLQKKLGLPEEKCVLHLADCGNTVSSTIPIAIKEAGRQGRLKEGMKVLLSGFGVGYSWGATICQY